MTLPTRAHRRRYDDWQRTDGGVWLPRAADVPLRGAGMVRRGMGFGFEPAGCCCGVSNEGCGEYGPMLYDPSGQYIVVSIAGVSGESGCYYRCLELNRDHEFSASDWAGYQYDPERQLCTALWQITGSNEYGGSTVVQLKFSLMKQTYPVATFRSIYFGYSSTDYYGYPCDLTLEMVEDGVYERWPNTDESTWSFVDMHGCVTTDAVANITIYDEPPSV